MVIIFLLLGEFTMSKAKGWQRKKRKIICQNGQCFLQKCQTNEEILTILNFDKGEGKIKEGLLKI